MARTQLRQARRLMTDREAMDTASWEEPDTRTPAEKYRDALVLAKVDHQWKSSTRRRAVDPTRVERHLDAVAFGAAVLERKPYIDRRNADAVFIAMVGARVKQRGDRPISPRSDWDVLRAAARAIAAAVLSVQEAA